MAENKPNGGDPEVPAIIASPAVPIISLELDTDGTVREYKLRYTQLAARASRKEIEQLKEGSEDYSDSLLAIQIRAFLWPPSAAEKLSLDEIKRAFAPTTMTYFHGKLIEFWQANGMDTDKVLKDKSPSDLDPTNRRGQKRRSNHSGSERKRSTASTSVSISPSSGTPPPAN